MHTPSKFTLSYASHTDWPILKKIAPLMRDKYICESKWTKGAWTSETNIPPDNNVFISNMILYQLIAYWLTSGLVYLKSDIR